MSTQSEEGQPKKGGFTVVFRLKRKGRDVLAEGGGAAGELIATKRADAVVRGRSLLSSDPILSGLYVVSSGDMSETQDVLEGLIDDKAVEKAYVRRRATCWSAGGLRRPGGRSRIKLGVNR